MPLFRSLFKPKNIDDAPAEVLLPPGLKSMSKWQPKIGSTAPNFKAPSTNGPISFHDYAEGRWVVLFSHPCAYTPVCTTEVADLAARNAEFEARNTALLGITHSSVAEEREWVAEIEDDFDVEVTFPLASDPQKKISNYFGIYEASSMPGFAIRRTLIIDPSLRIRMSCEYPVIVGRGTDEILRVIDALQACDKHQVATPSDWITGGNCLLDPRLKPEIADQMYGERWSSIRDYLRVVDIKGLEMPDC